jgi:poly(A) polymerase Pap1
VAAATDKREQDKQNKEVQVVTQVTEFASLLKTLEEGGEGRDALLNFTNDRLLDLLIHVDPRENTPKSKNKAENIEQVRALTTVQKTVNALALAKAATNPRNQRSRRLCGFKYRYSPKIII